MEDKELIYDWNSVEKVAPLSPKKRIQFLDETLREPCTARRRYVTQMFWLGQGLCHGSIVHRPSYSAGSRGAR